MRALTDSKVLVADKLFATLDTTVRALQPETKPRVLVSDAVGTNNVCSKLWYRASLLPRHSIVLRAKEPRRAPTSSCVDPRICRKSLVRNLPSLLAANVVTVFTDIPQMSLDVSNAARWLNLFHRSPQG
jgi:hypothetical protein